MQSRVTTTTTDTNILQKSYFPNIFWFLTLVKIISGTFFASHYVTKGFLPFIEYFVNTGHNPYDYFFLHGKEVFPYPAGMLLFSSPFLLLGQLLFGNVFGNTSLALFLFRLPLLFADISIYIVLCKLLPAKKDKVLWWYYASPILFYINYYHGQLDVLPTAFLFVSLFSLWKKKYFLSYLLLGIGLATKTHLMIVLPFYAIYLLREKQSLWNVLTLSFSSLGIFVFFNLLLFSHAYVAIVFNNIEQQRIFLTTIPYQYKQLTVFVAPAALLACLYIFASSNKRLNFDSLILILGLVYTVLIALVPPMQGWFYWSLPLFIFFLIKYKDSHLFSFLMTNIFFLLFFSFTKDSDIFESVSVSFPYFSSFPTPYVFLAAQGVNALQIQNILFTALQVSVGMNAFWSYKLGIFYNNLYIEKQKAFIIGIGGDSGVGKSTLSDGLTDIVGKHHLSVVNGDDSHRWERHDEKWEYFTHLNPQSNKVHTDVEQMYALVDGKTIKRTYYDHKSGKFTKVMDVEKNQFIIFQGLHPFYLESMRNVFDIKIFIEAEEKLRQQWKLERDVKERGYTKTKSGQVIKKRKKDAEKYIKPQKKFADWVIEYYLAKHGLGVKYTFGNSIPLEQLLDELNTTPHLKVRHTYLDTKLQSVTIEGTIHHDTITKIAYKLYPNLYELINHQFLFRDNSQGLNQLFFAGYLNYFYTKPTVIKDFS